MIKEEKKERIARPAYFRFSPVVEDNWTFKQIVETCCPISWEKPFMKALNQFKHLDMLMIMDFHKSGQRFLPRPPKIFRCFELVKLWEVDVVFICQDPYTREEDATGVALSQDRDGTRSASMRNFVAEIANSYPDKYPVDSQGVGDLTYIALQRVLFMNKDWTTREGYTGSKPAHDDLWKGVNTYTFQDLARERPGIPYVLVGGGQKNGACSLEPDLDPTAPKIKVTHPSPRSAAGNPAWRNQAFLGSKLFLQVDQLLIKQGKKPIDWRVL